MSDLARRPGNRLSRRERVDRAYRLVVVGGTAGLLAAVTGILAIVGIVGWTLPVIGVLVAIVCWVLFRRT